MPGMFFSHPAKFHRKRVEVIRTFAENLFIAVKLLRTLVENLLTLAELLRLLVNKLLTPANNKKTFAQFLRRVVLFSKTVFFIT